MGSVNPISDESSEVLPDRADENVTDLEEHRRRRNQAKAEVDLDQIMTDPRIAEIVRLGLKAVQRQEKSKAKKGGGNEGGAQPDTHDEESISLRYARHFAVCDEIRVGGSERGGRTVYVWDGSEAHWVAQNDKEARSHATEWLSRVVKKKTDAKVAKDCVETALDLYANRAKKRLPVQDPRRPILPVIGAYLRIDDQGVIRAEHPDMNAGVTHRVPAKLDWSRVDQETGIYTPRSLPADSKLAEYLNLFVPDRDVQNLLQEAVGSSLMPATGWHKAFGLIGGSKSQFDDGSNGKSTFLKFLEALHPTKVSVDLEILHKAADQIADLEGKTLAISTETPDHLGKQAEQRLKAIIAGDRIRGRALYQNARYFEPQLSLWIAMNGGGIKFHDRSPAMEERFIWFPFNVRVPRNSEKEIKNFSLLVTEDPEQMGYFLDWALEGVARLFRNRKRFSVKPTCIKAADEARRMETDPTYAWLVESRLEVAPNRETSKTTLYQAYKKSLLDSENYPLSEAAFWRTARGFMESKGFPFQERQPSAPRHLPRPGRTCNLIMQGVPDMDYRWNSQPVDAMPQTVADELHAPLF
jgi:hypothetical protein